LCAMEKSKINPNQRLSNPLFTEEDNPTVRLNDRLVALEATVRRGWRLALGLYLLLALVVLGGVVMLSLHQIRTSQSPEAESSSAHMHEMMMNKMPAGGCKMCRANREAIEAVDAKIQNHEEEISRLMGKIARLQNQVKENLPLPNGDSLEEKFGDTEEDYDNYYYPDNFNASMGDGYNYIDHSVSENNFDGTVSVAPEHVEYYDYNPSSFIDDADGYEDGNGSGGSGDDGFPTRTTDSQVWWR